MTQGEYLVAAYGVVLVVVVLYVAIRAAKLVRLQRDTAELVALARKRLPEQRTASVEVTELTGEA